MNEQIRFPYGNAFLVQTPAIDKMSDRLYLEQKQRELRREQEMKQLDDEFARNVAGIRDADVGDLSKAYADYKMSYKNLLKRPQGGTPSEQLDVLRKKADMYKIITESKQHRSYEEEVRKGLQQNPDKFEDDAHGVLFQSIRTPLSMMPDDLRNHDYLYKGTNTDFEKILKDAAGPLKPTYQKEEPVDKNNLQIKVTPYLYGNTPAQFKESVLGALAKNRAGRDAEAIISQVPPEVMDSIDKLYKSIPAERWQQMGVDAPQDLAYRNADSKAEKFATYQAQLYALNNLPKEGNPQFKDNRSALEQKREDFQLKKLAIQHSNAAGLVAMRHQFSREDHELNNLWIDEYVDKKTEEAKPSGYREAGKEWQGTKEVALDPVLENAMRINGKPADFMKLMPNGEYRYGFYARDPKTGALQKDGDHYAVDKESVRTISKEGVKLALGKQAGTKQLNMEMAAPEGTKKVETKSRTTSGKWEKYKVH